MGMEINICKYTAKLLYPKVEDNLIIRHGSMFKGTMESGTNNTAIDAFKRGMIVNTRYDANMHHIIDAKRNNVHNQFQVFLEGLHHIESLVNQDMALIPFALAHVNNVRGKYLTNKLKSKQDYYIHYRNHSLSPVSATITQNDI